MPRARAVMLAVEPMADHWPLPVMAVAHHGAVAGGVDVGHVGAHLLVHHHGALEEVDAGVLQEGGGGAHADGQHHHVGGRWRRRR